MKHVYLIAVLAVGLLIGCSNQRHYSEQLTRAHECLQEGEVDRAERHLTRADEIAADHTTTVKPSVDATLLQAEIRLTQRRLTESQELASSVTVRVDVDYPTIARAEEILGKIALHEGRFTEAQQHFLTADRNYDDDLDRERISNLMKLTRGLAAYSDGDIEVARRYWQSIPDAELRYSVSENLSDVQLAGVSE